MEHVKLVNHYVKDWKHCAHRLSLVFDSSVTSSSLVDSVALFASYYACMHAAN